MPSYEDFQSNPHRLYLLMQDQLAQGLQVQALQQQSQMQQNMQNQGQ